jgi:hypothetical protein
VVRAGTTEVLILAHTVHACVNKNGRPTRAPDWLVAAMKGAATSGSTLPEGMDRNIGLEAVRLTEAAAMEIEFFDFEDRWIRWTRIIGAACSRSRAPTGAECGVPTEIRTGLSTKPFFGRRRALLGDFACVSRS